MRVSFNDRCLSLTLWRRVIKKYEFFRSFWVSQSACISPIHIKMHYLISRLSVLHDNTPYLACSHSLSFRAWGSVNIYFKSIISSEYMSVFVCSTRGTDQRGVSPRIQIWLLRLCTILIQAQLISLIEDQDEFVFWSRQERDPILYRHYEKSIVETY